MKERYQKNFFGSHTLNNKGFTITELLVTVGLMGTVFLGISNYFSISQKIRTSKNAKIDMIANISLVAGRIKRSASGISEKPKIPSSCRYTDGCIKYKTKVLEGNKLDVVSYEYGSQCQNAANLNVSMIKAVKKELDKICKGITKKCTGKKLPVIYERIKGIEKQYPSMKNARFSKNISTIICRDGKIDDYLAITIGGIYIDQSGSKLKIKKGKKNIIIPLKAKSKKFHPIKIKN